MIIALNFCHFINLALQLHALFTISVMKILVLNGVDTDTFKVRFSMKLLLEVSSKITRDLALLKFTVTGLS